jgi:hypothetical protein
MTVKCSIVMKLQVLYFGHKTRGASKNVCNELVEYLFLRRPDESTFFSSKHRRTTLNSMWSTYNQLV